MYLWYSDEQGRALSPFRIEQIESKLEQVARFGRRGWYSATRLGAKGLAWSGSHMESAFLTIFPKAAPAFAKRDRLTGLNHGPSSYFLMSISEKRKKVARKEILS
jgi:hypothetical protein